MLRPNEKVRSSGFSVLLALAAATVEHRRFNVSFVFLLHVRPGPMSAPLGCTAPDDRQKGSAAFPTKTANPSCFDQHLF